MNKRKLVIGLFLACSLALILLLPTVVQALRIGNKTKEKVVKVKEDLELDEVRKNFPTINPDATKKYSVEYTIHKLYYRKGWRVAVKKDTLESVVFSKPL